MQTIVTGWHVMKWEGSEIRYVSVAWFKHRHEAEKEVKRLCDANDHWPGMAPIIMPSLERMF